MSRSLIVNASPLILLTRIERLDLLTALGDAVWVPEAVVRELEAGLDRDNAATVVRASSDLEKVGDLEIPERVQLWDLGAGESQVLVHGLRRTGAEAVLDDRAARRCARALSIPTIGTMGLVITCRHHGIVPAARPILEDLRKEGMRLKPSLMDEALAKVEE